MKRRIACVLMVLVLVMTCIQSNIVKAESKWDGYTAISTAYELADIANDLNGKYYLLNDIDMGSYGLWEPLGEFNGVLDGNGKQIKNLKISSVLDDTKLHTYVGFFQELSSTAEIKNLTLKSISYKISGSNSNISHYATYLELGGIAAYSFGTINNCKITGNIECLQNYVGVNHKYAAEFADISNEIGGIVGVNGGGGTILNCLSDITLSVNTNTSFRLGKQNSEIELSNIVGGIAGYNWGNISNSINRGNIVCSTNGSIGYDGRQSDDAVTRVENCVGGITGFNKQITDSAFYGNITNSFNIGKITGNADADCIDTYSGDTDDITEIEKNFVGGIIGFFSSGKLLYSYSSGVVNGSPVGGCGGAIGYADANSYSYNSYFLSNKNQKTKINADLNGIGENNTASNSAVDFLTISKMQSKSSFKEWDFSNTWTIIKGINNGYPILKSQTTVFQLPKATMSKKAGTYEKNTKISLKCATPDVKIYYTTNGTNPTKESKLYSKAITISKNTTLKVLVVKEGFKNSSIASYKYTVKK